MTKPAGLGQKSRSQLGKVLKGNRGVISVSSASDTLRLPREKTSQLLSRWAARGWIVRVKRGLYIPVPLEAESTDIAISEPWLLAQSMFEPCYIGGWTAAEHWDLTEQIFHSIVIITTKKVHQRDVRFKGARFIIKTVGSHGMFGTKPVWLEDHKINVSDPTRTILDLFNDPSLGGGIRSSIDVFSNYIQSKHKDLLLLLQYAEKLGNSAVYKRMGFVLERGFPAEEKTIEICRKNMRTGYSQLDPQTPSKALVTAWNLWVPESLKGKGVIK